jgi:hypothetical protein
VQNFIINKVKWKIAGVGLARALEMKRQRARCIRGLYRRHNSWYSRTITKKMVDELVTKKGCGIMAITLK